MPHRGRNQISKQTLWMVALTCGAVLLVAIALLLAETYR